MAEFGLPSSGAAGGAIPGGWELIADYQIAGTESLVDFTDLTVYQDYKVVIKGIHAAGAANCGAAVRVSNDNGVSFYTTGYNSFREYQNSANNTFSSGGTISVPDQFSFGSTQPVYGEVVLVNMKDASKAVRFWSDYHQTNASTLEMAMKASGWRTETETLNAIRVYNSLTADLYAGGSIELWGRGL